MTKPAVSHPIGKTTVHLGHPIACNPRAIGKAMIAITAPNTNIFLSLLLPIIDLHLRLVNELLRLSQPGYYNISHPLLQYYKTMFLLEKICAT